MNESVDPKARQPTIESASDRVKKWLNNRKESRRGGNGGGGWNHPGSAQLVGFDPLPVYEFNGVNCPKCQHRLVARLTKTGPRFVCQCPDHKETLDALAQENFVPTL